MKSGKLLKRCFVTICISLLSLLGVFCAGKNAQAFDIPSSYDITYHVEHPSWVPDGNVNDCHSYNNQNLWSNIMGWHEYRIYNNNVYCSGLFSFNQGDIIVIEIYGITGIIDLGNSGTPSFADSYLSIIGYDVNDTFDGTNYTFYGVATSTVSNVNPHINFYTRNTNGFKINSLVVYRSTSSSSTSSAILQEVAGCNGDSSCEQQLLKKWVYNIYGAVSGVSSTVSTISNNVIDIKDVLDDLGSDLSDITSNSNEENETNKTEKSNIENQSASDIGNTSDQKTESLMSAFGSFVTVVSSVRPTNCVINGSVRSDFSMGVLDFCSLPVPSFVTIIGSLILVIVVIGLTVSILKRIFGLIREMQS